MSDAAGGVIKSETAAKLLMMTERHLRRLVADDWIQKTADDKYTVVGCVQGYIRYLKDEARRGNATEGKSYISEVKARLAQEQADNVALKNQQLRGELVAVADVEFTWAGMVRDIRAAVLSIPSRFMGRVPTVTKAEAAILEAECREILIGLAEDNEQAAT